VVVDLWAHLFEHFDRKEMGLASLINTSLDFEVCKFENGGVKDCGFWPTTMTLAVDVGLPALH
jgi:hypothetical protein